jgi:hypothetical protein
VGLVPGPREGSGQSERLASALVFGETPADPFGGAGVQG